jgi:non-ribosomal peptide synthetase component F
MGGEALSYRELNQRSNKLAHTCARWEGADVLSDFARTSLDLMVGVLATLKAGGAYFLDPRTRKTVSPS